MYQPIALCLTILFGLSVSAQTINVSGKVTNQATQPVANAIVTLLHQGLKDTTGPDGSYSITKTSNVVLQAWVPQTENMSMENGMLQLALSSASPVKVDVYDLQGNLLKQVRQHLAPAGVYRFNVLENSRAATVLVINACIGRSSVTFRYFPFNSGKFVSNLTTQTTQHTESGLAKVTAINDTLSVTASGFKTKTTAITSYSQTVNVTLDSATGNAPGGSIGCGKDLSTLKSGTYTITSAGLSRQYIIDIPTGYDKTHPYRLIFGMHCYGSSMGGVASDKYYQLKRFADSTKTPCIFVAPNGYGSGTPLWDQGEKDHTFFSDMLKLFKDSLCVDTTRVFTCGFSYGAMFSYSLSIAHQKQLRAVACYAPANWNIWLPTDTHEPIAYFQTTGTDDPNCKWLFDTTKQEGGKYCLLGHIQDNGCTIPSTIPLATSSKHLSTEFSGCKSGYPVVFGSFQGGHQCGPMDGVSGDNSSKSWIPGETWKFFMQF